MRQILPGIRRIQVVDCNLLPPNVALKSEANLPISILADTVEISFIGNPQCERNSENDNNSTSEKTTLEFLTVEEFPFYKGNFAFIITCVSRESYLIGAREAPFPIVNVKQKTGTPSGDSAGYEVEVSFIAIKSLIPLSL